MAGIIIKFQRITQLIERARHTQTTDTLAMASLWPVALVVVCAPFRHNFRQLGRPCRPVVGGSARLAAWGEVGGRLGRSMGGI